MEGLRVGGSIGVGLHTLKEKFAKPAIIYTGALPYLIGPVSLAKCFVLLRVSRTSPTCVLSAKVASFSLPTLSTPNSKNLYSSSIVPPLASYEFFPSPAFQGNTPDSLSEMP